MGICTKHRRKITVGDRIYYWHIARNDDTDRFVLHIISADKKTNLSHPMQNSIQYIVSKGTIFQGIKSCGIWERFLLPFDTVYPITPKFVSDIIRWETTGEGAVKMDYAYDNGIWL